MVSESTIRGIKLVFSLFLAGAVAFVMYNYFYVEPWYYAVVVGLFFGVLFYLLSTERKAPTGVVTVLRHILVLLISGYFGYTWYQRTSNIEESVGIAVIVLIAAYVLIVKGFQKGGEEG